MQLSSNISALMKIPPVGFHIPEKQVDNLLLNDVKNFHRVNQGMSAQDAAETFLERWAGYKVEYSREYIETVFKIVMEL